VLGILFRHYATSLLYQPRIVDECGVFGGMRIDRGNRSTRRKPTPVPLFHHNSCPLKPSLPKSTHESNRHPIWQGILSYRATKAPSITWWHNPRLTQSPLVSRLKLCGEPNLVLILMAYTIQFKRLLSIVFMNMCIFLTHFQHCMKTQFLKTTLTHAYLCIVYIWRVIYLSRMLLK
jgi:hypothetical protein